MASSIEELFENASARNNADNDRLFTCPIEGCTKTFRRRYAIKEHAASHTGERAFICRVVDCHRRFTTSGNLSRHCRIQHPWLREPLKCLVDDCGCSFLSVELLERHVAMAHFDTTAFACPVTGCGRTFASGGNLRRHIRQRHDGDDNMKTSTGPVAQLPDEGPNFTGIDGTLTELSELNLWIEVASLFE